jgi:hypothetical protein
VSPALGGLEVADPIFIAVGGSGQHTMLAYLRLARLCNFPPARLMTIDADLRQGNGGPPTTASLIERQARIGFQKKVAWEPVRPLPEVNDCRVSRSSVATLAVFFVAVKSGKSTVPDSAGGGGIRDCF